MSPEISRKIIRMYRYADAEEQKKILKALGGRVIYSHSARKGFVNLWLNPDNLRGCPKCLEIPELRASRMIELGWTP